ncbi:MAG: hypothetical protein HYU69_09845 [Bacteroidetes bacterium]|nr:hypothetical protein [Bacteroidota bacterium]
MSYLSSDDLFTLIKRLSQSEKRHFKIYASRHVIGGENNYVRLFDAIDSQKDYNEEELLKTEKYIRQLPLLKTRLYKIILKCLEGFTGDIKYELRSMLNQAGFLYQKGLFRQYFKLLDKAYQIALKHDLYSYIAEIALLKISGMGRSGIIDIHDLQELWDDEKRATDNLMNLTTYKKISREFEFYWNDAGMRHPDKQRLTGITRLMASPFLRDESKAINVAAKRIFHIIHENYNQAIDNWEQAYLHGKKRIELLDSNPYLVAGDPNLYLASMRNILVQCSVLKKYKEAEKYLDDIQTAAEKYNFKPDERGRALIFLGVYEFEIDRILFLGEFAKGCTMIPEIERKLIEHEETISEGHRAHFYLWIVTLYFGDKQFRKSLKYLNQILSQFKAIQQTADNDIYCTALIMSIIVRYELKDFETLPYILRAIYRHLRKKERLFKFESIVLDFIRKKLPALNTSKELIAAFEILKGAMEKAMRDPDEPRPLVYVDYVCWIDSKIDNRSYAEVVKEEANKIMKVRTSL